MDATLVGLHISGRDLCQKTLNILIEFSFLQAPPKGRCSGSAATSEGEEDENEEEDDAKPQTTSPSPPHPLLIGSCSGFIETTVKIKQNDMLPGPKVCVLSHMQCTTVSSSRVAWHDIWITVTLSCTICLHLLPAIHTKAPNSPDVVLLANSAVCYDGVLHKAETTRYQHRICIMELFLNS